MLNKRRSLTPKDVQNMGKMIFNKLIELPEYQNSKLVLCYVSFDNEVDTLGIISYSLACGKKVGIPKVIGNKIEFYYIDDLSRLHKGTYGILEPETNNKVPLKEARESLLIVPGTSFSPSGYRNGYGKGYFDKFIAKTKPKYKIGLAYDFQVLDNIYSEKYDEKLDIVISDKNIYNSAMKEPKKVERYKEIERSIITKFRKDIWSKFVKACEEYELIKENDNIMVCISGGKDSFLLAKCIQELQRHGMFYFDAHFVVMDPGYSKAHRKAILDNAKLLDIPIEIFESDIFDVVTSVPMKSPCYLCARMRRGHLYSKAKELGCNKIALGHHFNDVIETTLLSMFYGCELKTMPPKLHSDNYKGIDLIRPLYLVKEDAIIAWKNYNKLEFLNCACKFTDGVVKDELSSKRLEIKNLIKELKKTNPEVDHNIFKAMDNINLNCVLGYKKDNKYTSFLDDFDRLDK